jgi:hypothetical protein
MVGMKVPEVTKGSSKVDCTVNITYNVLIMTTPESPTSGRSVHVSLEGIPQSLSDVSGNPDAYGFDASQLPSDGDLPISPTGDFDSVLCPGDAGRLTNAQSKDRQATIRAAEKTMLRIISDTEKKERKNEHPFWIPVGEGKEKILISAYPYIELKREPFWKNSVALAHFVAISKTGYRIISEDIGMYDEKNAYYKMYHDAVVRLLYSDDPTEYTRDPLYIDDPMELTRHLYCVLRHKNQRKPVVFQFREDLLSRSGRRNKLKPNLQIRLDLRLWNVSDIPLPGSNVSVYLAKVMKEPYHPDEMIHDIIQLHQTVQLQQMNPSLAFLDEHGHPEEKKKKKNS